MRKWSSSVRASVEHDPPNPETCLTGPATVRGASPATGLPAAATQAIHLDGRNAVKLGITRGTAAMSASYRRKRETRAHGSRHAWKSCGPTRIT